MWLQEAEHGFVVRRGGPLEQDPGFVRDLLELLSRGDIPFVIGGAAGSDILTIEPRTFEQRSDVAAWWQARHAGAAADDQ